VVTTYSGIQRCITAVASIVAWSPLDSCHTNSFAEPIVKVQRPQDAMVSNNPCLPQFGVDSINIAASIGGMSFASALMLDLRGCWLAGSVSRSWTGHGSWSGVVLCGGLRREWHHVKVRVSCSILDLLYPSAWLTSWYIIDWIRNPFGIVAVDRLRFA
jgi:hypothetical protein